MSDYDNLINSFDIKIGELDIKLKADRIKVILDDFNNNILNLTELSDYEKIFVHSKLHMNFYNKHSILTREQIKIIHSELIEIMPLHKDFDDLDGI